MKIAFFTGNHDGDTLLVRMGWWVTQLVQKGPYGSVTHVEAIHAEHLDGTVTISSASVRDGGVRCKCVKLNPKNWMIVDVPSWDVEKSVRHLASTEGCKYDWRGAIATAFIGSQDDSRWFCNEHVSYPFLKASATFGPHHLAAICLSIGKDVTTTFFKSRDRQ